MRWLAGYSCIIWALALSAGFWLSFSSTLVETALILPQIPIRRRGKAGGVAVELVALVKQLPIDLAKAPSA